VIRIERRHRLLAHEQERLQRLSAMGIPTEFHVYEGLGHGFGIGTGTMAEGRVAGAIRFREANMQGGAAVILVKP